MQFQQYGRTYQLRIESAEDLKAILEMDEAHWMTTSAPVTAFRCDAKLLAYLDADADSRIHSNELKAAIRWLLDQLADTSQLHADADSLPLAAVRTDTPAGKALTESARYILTAGGNAEQHTVSLGTVREFLNTVQSRLINGDGVVVPDAATTPTTVQFLQDAVCATQGTPDASGRTGVTEKQVNAFLQAIPGYLEWRQRGELPPDQPSAEHMPFGSDTATIHEVYRLHADKVDLFFELCQVAEFDARTLPRLAGPDSALQQLEPVEREQVTGYLQNLPIAAPTADKQLPLAERSVNPLYRPWLRDLKQKVLGRAFDDVPEQLSEAAWRQVKTAFASYEAYLTQKSGSSVEKVPLDRLHQYLDPTYKQKAQALFDEDRTVAGVLEKAHGVEKLLLLHQHLLRFANNFVSFPKLYATDQRAMFEMGALVMDGRWFNFAVKVENLARHTAVAKQSNLFVMYVQITRAGAPKATIAVPVTAGTKGNLAVGKRGVFFDTVGKEYDAQITQVIDNPISLREALGMPFIRLWRLVEGKIETWSGAAEKEFLTKADKAVVVPGSGKAAKSAKPASPQPAVHMAGGAFVGIGVATAALGSAFAFITKTFAGMESHHVVYGFLGAAALVILPVSLIAFLKLRRQDLSALLEGCGWAINARMRLSRNQRRFFTCAAPYPADAVGTPRRTGWRNVGIVVVLLLFIMAILALFQACPVQLGR